MDRSVAALYDTIEQARHAVQELVQSRFKRESISLVAVDSMGHYARHLNTEAKGEDGVTTGQGAGFGAVIGALTGTLFALSALTIPGVGPVIAAGPVLAALTEAGVGMVAGSITGGIVASLVKSGVPRDEAALYSEGVRRGGSLVIVATDDAHYAQARTLLDVHNPIKIRELVSTTVTESTHSDDTQRHRYNASPTTQRNSNRGENVDAAAKPVDFNTPADQVTFEYHLSDYRTNYNAHYANRGYDFNQFLAAYRYGYILGTLPRYQNNDWADIEEEAERGWEKHHPNYPWDIFKGAVRYALDSVRHSAAAVRT
jgi:hypothetical protein